MNNFLKNTFLITTLCATYTLGDGCICPAVFQPVCGSNGVTFSNLCQLQCEQQTQTDLTLVSNGHCEGKNTIILDTIVPPFEEFPNCACSLELRPVCGNDGTTYGNLCQLHCAQETNPSLDVASYGECGTSPERTGKFLAGGSPSKCICTREYSPICASNHIMYTNRCQFECAKKIHDDLSILLKGPCPEELTQDVDLLLRK